MTHRSWFPTILTGLSLALLAIIVVVYKDEAPQAAVTPAFITATAPTSTEYETAAKTVVQNYVAGGNAATAYNALVALTVPAEYQDAHLALVFAFADLRAGKLEEGTARLDVARTAYPWLATP